MTSSVKSAMTLAGANVHDVREETLGSCGRAFVSPDLGHNKL